MSEGGLFSWKIQSIDNRRGPAGSYSNMRLPEPPKDQHWVQDVDSKEWHLATIVPSTDPTVPEATVEEDPRPGVLEHRILPTDTFQGICLKYKITPTELRRANGGFSGTNLNLVANPLRIPVNQKYWEISKQQDTKQATPAQTIRRLLLNLPTLSQSEAKCYLELNDWNFEKALENARDDGF